MPNNIFCDLATLQNEADVEQNFIRRFVEHLFYTDAQIRPKEALSRHTVTGMRGQKASYYPDFALKIGEDIRWIVEAKAPQENLDHWEWQARGYCVLLNGLYRNDNPVRYFLLTNGLETRLYQWDVNDPLLILDFADFEDNNPKYKQLRDLIAPNAFIPKVVKKAQGTLHKLEKLDLADVNAAFAWCHQFIYKKDNINQAAAFTEFTKVIFLKLISDRNVRDKYPEVFVEKAVEVPVADVHFSSAWIESQQANTPNPISSIQFHDFNRKMEADIQLGKRKRIFDEDEEINLSPETIKGVVKRIEHIFLFGIDVDLNGRLFETFLNATMRGKDLGQFFTPRSIVVLAARLAQIQVYILSPDGSRHTDTVLDACCGTGGFLIDALAEMWLKVDGNPSLDPKKRIALKKQIADHHMIGVDIGREPPLARITRLNMYLHGDGGSSIYQVDALDKEIADTPSDSPELTKEKAQIREKFIEGNFIDVVLTNPPFAKTYDRKTDSEARILDGYEIARNSKGKVPALKSSLMFLERYYDLLRVGGRIVTVIDDGILSGKSYAWFRKYIRSHFLVRAVISLPGDAFQRSKARVKTSLLIAEKRDPAYAQEQPSVFMYGCEYVGIDDPSRQRTLPIDREIQLAARREIETVTEAYEAFLSGKGKPEYIVPASRISDRLDVKSCLMKAGRLVKHWQEAGIPVEKLEKLADEKEFSDEEIINTRENDDFVTYLRVRYDGFAQAGDEILASETEYEELYRVSAGDIVISNIAASYGSVAIVPPELEGCVVTSEYTVLRPKAGVDGRVLWMTLRSPEIRSDMLLLATGISRNRVSWDDMKAIYVPQPKPESASILLALIQQAEAAEQLAQKNREEARVVLETPLQLNNDEANHVLKAFKPPK